MKGTFHQGDIREDGWIFMRYRADGSQYWASPEAYETARAKNRAAGRRYQHKKQVIKRAVQRAQLPRKYQIKAIGHHYAKGRDADWITLMLNVPQSQVLRVIEDIRAGKIEARQLK